MRKMTLCIILIIASILTLLVLSVVVKNTNNKTRYIECELKNIVYADFSVIRYQYENKLIDEFSWYYQARNEAEFRGLQKRFQLSDCDFDFKSHYMVISLGNPILSISYKKNFFRPETHEYVATVEFDTSTHSQHKAYVYSMSKIPLVNEEFYGSAFGMKNKLKESKGAIN